MESVSVKAAIAHIFQPGVRNWSVSMSWCEIKVFIHKRGRYIFVSNKKTQLLTDVRVLQYCISKNNNKDK